MLVVSLWMVFFEDKERILALMIGNLVLMEIPFSLLAFFLYDIIEIVSRFSLWLDFLAVILPRPYFVRALRSLFTSCHNTEVLLSH